MSALSAKENGSLGCENDQNSLLPPLNGVTGRGAVSAQARRLHCNNRYKSRRHTLGFNHTCMSIRSEPVLSIPNNLQKLVAGRLVSQKAMSSSMADVQPPFDRTRGRLSHGGRCRKSKPSGKIMHYR